VNIQMNAEFIYGVALVILAVLIAVGTIIYAAAEARAARKRPTSKPSRLRIDFRQFVGDVGWLGCAESSSG
jgi:hypothetical protein